MIPIWLALFYPVAVVLTLFAAKVLLAITEEFAVLLREACLAGARKLREMAWPRPMLKPRTEASYHFTGSDRSQQ